MTKYDEFGRPIYETAEEYNKAHKKGNSSRTYDSPEGDAYKHKPMKTTYHSQRMVRRNTNSKGVKKSKLLIIGIAVYFIAMIVFLSFNMVRRSVDSSYEVIPENVGDVIVNVGDESGEFLGDDTTPLSEGFETFSYNEQTYSLPTTMEEIEKMGFTLEEEYDETYMIPMEYEENLILNDEDHSEEGSFYDSYEWAYYGEKEIHFVCITFWNGVISNVGIEKRVIEE